MSFAHLNPPRPNPKTDAERGRFGALLRELRMARHLSQSKLAERAGYDHSYCSRIEVGARTPSRDAVTQIAAALHASDADRDRLMATAGFLPRTGQLAVIEAEPALIAAVTLLGDETVADELRDAFRQQLLSLCWIYRVATATEGDE